MSFPRLHGRTPIVFWMAAGVFLLAPHTLAAQTPSSAPTATPVPADSLPSAPVATPATNAPAATPGYQDPLEKPIIVAPGPQTPAPMPVATPLSSSQLPSMPAYNPDTTEPRRTASLGSAYIPVDSTIYPMALRLYSMGFLDSAFINMRPWTRLSLLHMLQKSSANIMDSGNDEAVAILAKLEDTLDTETPGRGNLYGVESVYTRLLGIDGQSLRDSFHLGQTIVNDYGRPYEPGFNNITGFSTLNEYGRFSLYIRGEYQRSPSAYGYTTAGTGNPLAPAGLAYYLSNVVDQILYPTPYPDQAILPAGPIPTQNPFRLQEAALSFHVLGHEISGGKTDAWLGPAVGGAMGWSNNAEDIYSFRINRVEPLHIPFVSNIIGDLRYDFFVGSLKGHTYPNSPWVHSEMFSFAPTKNFQFAFQRTVIWGGHGHEPITLHTFFRSFFSTQDTQSDPSVKNSAQDPGARFSDFSFSWRLPFLSHYVTLYTDSEAHDDVSPISAPRRAAYRPGIYLSHLPGLPKLDFRVEGASTDTSTTISIGGRSQYYETIQRQGYTNKGFIFGDWIGREAKGGQAWLTYHLSANEWVQLEYLTKKNEKDFITGGTTQNQFKAEVVKRLRKDIELDAWVQYERWKAPVYLNNPNNGANNDTAIAAQVTWFPKLRKTPGLNGK